MAYVGSFPGTKEGTLVVLTFGPKPALVARDAADQFVRCWQHACESISPAYTGAPELLRDRCRTSSL